MKEGREKAFWAENVFATGSGSVPVGVETPITGERRLTFTRRFVAYGVHFDAQGLADIAPTELGRLRHALAVTTNKSDSGINKPRRPVYDIEQLTALKELANKGRLSDAIGQIGSLRCKAKLVDAIRQHLAAGNVEEPSKATLYRYANILLEQNELGRSRPLE